MGRFPDSRKKILITHLLTKAWIQVCSQPNSLERYLFKVGFAIYATREDDHLFFPQKFSSSDYFFVCASGDNSVSGLIQPTPDSSNTTDACFPYEYLVDTLVDDMLDAMEIKNDKICDISDSRFGEEHIMDEDTYSISDAYSEVVK